MISAFGVDHGEVSKAFTPANITRAGKAFNLSQNLGSKMGFAAKPVKRAQAVAASAGKPKYPRLP